MTITKILAFIGSLLLFMSLAACEQTLVKSGFKNMSIDIPCGKKFINVTWKDNNARDNPTLWILTKDMNSGDIAEKYQFSAKTPTGLFQGTVFINECSL